MKQTILIVLPTKQRDRHKNGHGGRDGCKLFFVERTREECVAQWLNQRHEESKVARQDRRLRHDAPEGRAPEISPLHARVCFVLILVVATILRALSSLLGLHRILEERNPNAEKQNDPRNHVYHDVGEGVVDARFDVSHVFLHDGLRAQGSHHHHG